MTDLCEIASLNTEELLQIIECPGCMLYMDKKIYVCAAGHSCCGNCQMFMTNCPICRGIISGTRNFTLESLAEMLYYHVTLTKYNEHTFCCKLYQCLLTLDGANCPWSGQYHEIVEHANEKHKDKAWMQEENNDRWREEFDDEDVQLIKAHGKLFYIFRRVIGEESMMYWAVQCIGSAEGAKYYGYELTIYCQESHRELRFAEICHNDRKTMKQIIDTGKCVGVPMKTLKTFKNGDSSVSFNVKIKKREIKWL